MSVEPLFMVDHMLTRLGKYLRIIGYDAAWDPTRRTHELIVQANREGRVFVTRNRHIADAYPQPDSMVVLDADDPVEQFEQIVHQFRLDPQARLFTKCIICNVFLEPVSDRASVRDRVHPNVFSTQQRFFTCPNCGTVFWWGSHVRNTCRKLRLTPPCAA